MHEILVRELSLLIRVLKNTVHFIVGEGRKQKNLNLLILFLNLYFCDG